MISPANTTMMLGQTSCPALRLRMIERIESTSYCVAVLPTVPSPMVPPPGPDPERSTGNAKR